MIDIQWLVSTGPCKKYIAGDNIPCPGGPDSSNRAMYILLTGRVDVYKKSAVGGKQILGSFLPGDIFGGREYFTDFDELTYFAAVDSVVFLITETSFNELSWSRPDILLDVLKASYLPLRKISAAQDAKISQKKGKPGSVVSNLIQDKPKPHVEYQAVFEKPVGIITGQNELFPENHKHEYYIGIIEPEFSKCVFQKEYKCPACNRTFIDYKIFRSKLYESKAMRYDLRKYFTGFRIEWYEVVTCRNCLFSAFNNYFTDPKPLLKPLFENELISIRSSLHIDFDTERDLEYVFTSHYLALLCSRGYKPYRRQIKAKLWGNLSWLYEDLAKEAEMAEDTSDAKEDIPGEKINISGAENPEKNELFNNNFEMMKFAALNAAKEYEALYSEIVLTPAQEQITCLSIAGMQHRAEVNSNLKKFLFRAKTMKGGDPVYARLAEDFMYELRLSDES